MSKTFKGFTNKQTHQLLTEQGYTGPAQKDDMDKFLAASPGAAAILGRYTDLARQRIEGGPLAETGKTLAVDAKGNTITSAAGGTFIYKGKYVSEQEFNRLSAEDAAKKATPTPAPTPQVSQQVTPPATPTGSPKAIPPKPSVGQPLKDPNFKMEDLFTTTKPISPRIGDTDQLPDMRLKPEDEPISVPSVLQQGTTTPEETEAAKLLDLSQKASSDAGLEFAKVQKNMSGKNPEDTYADEDGNNKPLEYSSITEGSADHKKTFSGGLTIPSVFGYPNGTAFQAGGSSEEYNLWFS